MNEAEIQAPSLSPRLGEPGTPSAAPASGSGSRPGCTTCGNSSRPDCPTCGTERAEPVRTSPPYVYALGRIEPRITRLSVEKEIQHVLGRSATHGLTDRQALQKVLAERQNRYLARQLCWVFTIEGLETYLLQPADPADMELLTEAIRLNPTPMDLDVVVGTRGAPAPPEMCNGLMIPIVTFDQIYSFDRNSLIKSIPRPEKQEANGYDRAAEELLDLILQLADNGGATDGHRAVNYLAVRYSAIYTSVADAFAKNWSLTAVDTRSSPLSGFRKVVDVIFSYSDRSTDVVHKFFARVDVTEEFPFLVTKISPYFDR